MTLSIGLLLAILSQSAGPMAPGAITAKDTVRDHFWAWSHDAGVYNGAWGLPGTSSIAPVEGAHFLNVPNIILIRYLGKPAPPFEDYFTPFTSLKRVCWSIAGANGATSDEEREHVFHLAETHPNITCLFMDDFFQFSANDVPQWLAENNVKFPVTLTVTLASPAAATSLEMAQSAWGTGDYRSGDFVIDTASKTGRWNLAGQGRLPNTPGAKVRVEFSERQVASFRVRILTTQDTGKALSCGLSQVRLYSGREEIPLNNAKASASSTFPGHGAEMVLGGQAPSAPAALSVEQLEAIHTRMASMKRPLSLGVTLYTYQLTPSIVPYLDHCDIISLWTWKAEDLDDLEKNLACLKTMMPAKRIWLGCYMWDFGTNRPMPIERMRRQCEYGLKCLKERHIDGMIFLATNLCDLNLETVEWTRQWIARVGGDSL